MSGQPRAHWRAAPHNPALVGGSGEETTTAWLWAWPKLNGNIVPTTVDYLLGLLLEWVTNTYFLIIR